MEVGLALEHRHRHVSLRSVARSTFVGPTSNFNFDGRRTDFNTFDGKLFRASRILQSRNCRLGILANN